MQSSTLQSTAGQLATTSALCKFCEVHGHAEGWLRRLDAVLHAMEARDAKGVAGALAPFTGVAWAPSLIGFPSHPWQRRMTRTWRSCGTPSTDIGGNR